VDILDTVNGAAKSLGLPTVRSNLADYFPELGEIRKRIAAVRKEMVDTDARIYRLSEVERTAPPKGEFKPLAEFMGRTLSDLPDDIDAEITRLRARQGDLKATFKALQEDERNAGRDAFAVFVKEAKPLHDSLGRSVVEAFLTLYSAASLYRAFHALLAQWDKGWPSGGMYFHEGHPNDWQSGWALFLRDAAEHGLFDIADMPEQLASPHELWIKTHGRNK